MNHSPFDTEDQRLTAYALGELPDEAERASVEQLLADSPEARAAVEEIRSFAALLTAEYDSERQQADQPGAAIEPLAPTNVIAFTPRKAARGSWMSHPLLKIAALLMAVAALGYLLMPVGNKAMSEARHASVPAALPVVGVPPREADSQTAMATPPPASAPLPTRPPERDEFAMNGTADSANKPASLGTLDNSVTVQSGGGALANNGKASMQPAQPSAAAPGAPAEPLLSMTAPSPIAESRSKKEVDFLRQSGSTGRAAPPLVASAKSYRGAEEVSARRAQPSSVTSFHDRSPVNAKSAVPAKPSVQQGATVFDQGRDMEPMDAEVIDPRVPAPSATFNTATYDHVAENPFLTAKENPLSTFSIDVDTASYSNVRRFIESGTLPPKDAVRIEEMLNYFPYNDAPPAEGDPHPFAIHLEAAACPWNLEHRLVRIGIKGREIAHDKRPASNLVFLIDVSGSMMPRERLPLVKAGLRLLVEKLSEDDHVAIVVYAGNSGLALPSTSGDHKTRILDALDRLEAGGSTNGADGIQLAYKVARENFIKGGVNRVILATDGDFNVGTTSQGELIRLIEKEAKSGVFLSALGVGTDNYKDSTMQKLADRGNGNYAYIDRLEEARKVLVEQMSGTLVTIAKDVKIQVEFNPAAVASYRLIGYEKRMLRKEDFNNDRVDAGEIGAGHTVTALYEIVPVGSGGDAAAAVNPAVDALKYQSPAPAPSVAAVAPVGNPPELLTLKMRYKAPDADKSERSQDQSLLAEGERGDFAKASPDFKFSAAVAGFGLVLRDSPNKGNLSFGAVVELAQDGKGPDGSGYRAQFIDLVRRANRLTEEGRGAR